MTDPVNRLDVGIGMEQVVNRAQVTVYPVETIGSLQVIWTARTTLRLAPGETRVVYALFRDSVDERCGAVDVASLTATTDYLVYENSDGSGFNYTSDPAFSISMDVEATRAKLTLENSAIGNLYVTHLQIRGKPLEAYDPLTIEEEDTTSQTAYEVRAWALNLPMLTDPVFGKTYAEYLISQFSEPALAAARLVVRNRPTINGVSVFSLDIMDEVRVSDAQTGLSGVDHWVRAVEYDLDRGRYDVTLHLERADNQKYWLLGKVGYSELGSTTRLGF